MHHIIFSHLGGEKVINNGVLCLLEAKNKLISPTFPNIISTLPSQPKKEFCQVWLSPIE